MKRNLTLIAFLAGALATGICNAADEAQGIPLVLLNAVSSPAQVGDTVQLRDTNCLYVGKLEQRKGEPESFWRKLLNQAGGNVGSWSIAVYRKVCGSIEAPVVLTIPLRNFVSKDAYKAGETVTAYPDK
ncbi:hypothetical protein [Janthinobacterium sp. CAN_S7]|uniref:hypothetical protein n=1 Tax=Janthinobacterium sp. CAN_S7 TaxID=3071704 RepID=UPI00319E19A0